MSDIKLKVSDLLPFDESDFLELKELIDSMMSLTEDYIELSETNSIEELERLKKEFIGKMQRYTVLYAKVKRFKGSTHTFLDEQRKRVKSQAIQILLDEGKNSTNANNLVYASNYYVDRVDLMENIKGFFIKVDELHKQFEGTIKAIAQSISVQSKDKNYSNMS